MFILWDYFFFSISQFFNCKCTFRPISTALYFFVFRLSKWKSPPVGHQKSPKLLDEFRHGTSQRERQKKGLRSFFSTQGICQWIRDLLSLRHNIVLEKRLWYALFKIESRFSDMHFYVKWKLYLATPCHNYIQNIYYAKKN